MVKMTKQDYELIAGVFAKGIVTDKESAKQSDDWIEFSCGADYQLRKLATELGEAFEARNPKARFDRDKFLTACGIETGDYCPLNRYGEHTFSGLTNKCDCGKQD
jgi:hypothetical protein